MGPSHDPVCQYCPEKNCQCPFYLHELEAGKKNIYVIRACGMGLANFGSLKSAVAVLVGYYYIFGMDYTLGEERCMLLELLAALMGVRTCQDAEALLHAKETVDKVWGLCEPNKLYIPGV